MKNSFKKILIFLLAVLISAPVLTAKAGTYTGSDTFEATSTKVYFGNTPYNSARFKVTKNGQTIASSSYYNGFCIEPTWSNHSENVVLELFTSSDDSNYYYEFDSKKLPLKAIAYFSYDAPGWDSEIATKYSQVFSQSGYTPQNGNDYALLSAVVFSYFYSNATGVSSYQSGFNEYHNEWEYYYNESSGRTSAGFNGNDIKTIAPLLYDKYQSVKDTKPYKEGFKAYVTSGESAQDMMFWEEFEVSEDYGYIEVTKTVENNAVDLNTNRFKMNVCEGDVSVCTTTTSGYKGTFLTNSSGKITYGIVNNEATLELGDKYTISEVVDGNGYAKVFNSSGTEITGSSKPYVKPSNNKVLIEITNVTNNGGINSATLTNTRYGYLKIHKDTEITTDFSKYHFSFYVCEDANGTSTGCYSNTNQIFTNNNGDAIFGLDSNGNPTLKYGNKYIATEVYSGSNKYATVYKADCSSYSDKSTCPVWGNNEKPYFKPVHLTSGVEGVKVTISGNNEKGLSSAVVNNRLYGSIAVQKTGNNIDKSRFRFKYYVCDSSSSVCNSGYKITTIMTDATGKAIYRGSPDGPVLELQSSYKVAEVVDPNGYAIIYDADGNTYTGSDKPIVKPVNDVIIITVKSENIFDNYGETVGEYENQYGYCLNIEKVDSKVTSNKLSGAVFTLFSDSNCSTSTGKTATTNASGIATFSNLTNNSYYVKETTGIAGYSINTTCKKVTPIQNEGSACQATPVEVKEAPYYISFYKVDENGNGIKDVKFKVKTGNSYITVSGRSSEYDNCYVYTGSNASGTEMKTDSNGSICVVKVPDATYTAYEQESPDGYVFENGKIENITVNTNIQGKADSNSLINKPYVITFYKLKDKYNNTGESDYLMENAVFKVKKTGTNTFIKVNSQKSNLTDYKGCYVYDENGTVTEMKTDANGRICIIKIPKDDQNTKYEAIEQDTGDARYYVDEDNKTITDLVPTNSIVSITRERSLINYAYYINFFKTDEEGNPMKGVKFKVKNSKNNYVIAADKNSDSNYPGCYVYSDTNAASANATEFVTDENGEICIVKVLSKTSTGVLTYSAIETSTENNKYFVDPDNKTIENITVKEMPSNKTRTGINDNNSLKLANKPYVINFYKVTEKSTRVGGAEFVLTNSEGKYVTVDSTASNVSGYKGCYKYTGLSTTKTASTKLVSSSTDTSGGVKIGEVCIIKLPEGTYKATETKPVEYHTFGNVVTKSFTTAQSRSIINDDNKFKNEKTEFKFTKTVSEENGYDDIYKTLTSEELTKIPFTIYDNSGNAVNVIKTSEGVYEYAGNTIDGIEGTAVSSLYLNTDRELYVYHLPKGTYTIKESECCCDSECSSPSTNNCYGFYSPKYDTNNTNSYSFTIDNCSTSKTTGKNEKDQNVCSTSIATQTLDNTPTEVDFTKSDFYSYADPNATVKFEDEEEISAFDNITFKVYYYNSNNEKVYVNFTKVGNNGTCKTESSYSEYRFVPEDTPDSIKSQLQLTDTLHTCGGHIHLTHLCRGRKYYIEEVSVPENTVFTLPETEEARTREIDLSCCQEDKDNKPSTTTIIEDKPTRVTFEKRDSKYGYLIPDESTTFKLYRCSDDNCHPSDYSTDEERKQAGINLVKFNPRAEISGDEEDTGIEVYKAILNTENETNFVTELHPYYGRLVLRYLESGHKYVLLETASPQGYTLPKGRNAETSFTVKNNTIEVEEVDVVNKPTSLLIRKYADDGELLEGAQFRIYEGTTCDKNLTAKAQPKIPLSLKTIRDGIYENREVKDTDLLITCTDKDDYKCSDISNTLTLDTYVDTWANFDNSLNQTDQRIEIQAGEILIQYLEYGHCYIIEEVKAPSGYSLPEKEEDRFVMVTIEKENDVVDTYKELVNRPTPFTFYKYDDKNNLIDGGEFKLQKLNNDKKYEDLTVTEEEVDGKYYYKVDKNSTNKKIKTKNGSATIYYLEEGQYRVVETKAPEGMELPAKEINVAVFFVDQQGRVIGNNIITNKPKTEKIELKPKASAELIVNISTGMERIRYGLALAVIVLLTFGLLFVQAKRKKN